MIPPLPPPLVTPVPRQGWRDRQFASASREGDVESVARARMTVSNIEIKGGATSPETACGRIEAEMSPKERRPRKCVKVCRERRGEREAGGKAYRKEKLKEK